MSFKIFAMPKPSLPPERWKKSYTLVLIANAVYIILFYFITKSF